jgi:hypothetical protein
MGGIYRILHEVMQIPVHLNKDLEKLLKKEEE